MSAAPISHSGYTLLKRLAREHIRPYRKHILIAIGCMVVSAMATAANAWMIQPMLDKIFIERNRAMLMIIPFGIIVIAIAGAAANFGNTLAMRYVGQRIIADMQVRLFEHLMKSDIGLFHNEASGRLISRFTSDIQMMRNAFSSVLTAIARESLSMVFLIGVMFYQNVELAIIAMLAFPLIIYPVIRLGKRMRRLSDKTQAQLGNFAAALDEVFHGVRTVKSYNRETFESNRARSTIEQLFTLYFKGARVQAAASPMTEMLSGISIASVVWYGGAQVLAGETTPGAFFSFITAFLMAYRPVRAMAGLNTVLQEGIAAASRLFNVIDIAPSIADRPDAAPLRIGRGAIRFENITFRYPQNGRGVDRVTFEAPAGKTTALVGLSGGGKSTLVNLLLRFYEAQDGRILIDDQDVRDITLHSLRAAMAFVPQESMLFDDTVRANIAYGREGASEADILEAAKNAAADEFIRQLPQGYDTPIGAHGVRLSGGQRQRIAVARAMLKNAPILLLDEATSSLDNESERSIQQALTRLMSGRTTLVVAHRLSTIVNADLIHVVEGGRIVESGNHAGLMERQGRYWQLYASNFQDTDPA